MTSFSEMAPGEQRFASIKEVARRAGVSPSTVSRVLGGHGYSSDASRAKVMRAVKELGYEPDLAASMLKSRASAIIGVEIQDITNPFYASMASGIADVARSASHVPFLSDSQEDPAREAENLRMMLRIRVAGLIITPTVSNAAILRRFQELGIPVVQVDRLAPGVVSDSVLVDNERASRRATGHLIELGHERIGVIAGPRTLTTGHDRLRGFEAEMGDRGLPVDPRLVKTSDYRRDTGAALARELLDERPAPTAIMTHNNVLAEGLLTVISERRLSVPDDVAVVSFDDPSWARLVTPPLTVLRQPARKMGALAADLLLRRLRDPDDGDATPTRVELELSLVVRGSCGGTPSQQDDGEAMDDDGLVGAHAGG